MNHTRQRYLIVLATLCLVLGIKARCTAAEQLSGKGEWHSLSSPAIKGTWDTNLTRDDGRVEGNLDLIGSNVFSGGKVAGSIDDSGVTLGVMVDGAKQATFTGVLKGDSISGEWVLEDADVHDSGVWFGSLTAK